jgi:hypothetical protein
VRFRVKQVKQETRTRSLRPDGIRTGLNLVVCRTGETSETAQRGTRISIMDQPFAPLLVVSRVSR